MGYRGNHGEGQRRRSTAALLAAYHHRGDRSARTRVIEQNLPLVHSLARRFSRPSEPLDDLVQAGAIGLIKAVDGFRDDRGRDLGAYAVPTIVGELRRHVRERASASSVAELEEETLAAGARSQAETSEMRELVRAALDVLSPRERRIVAPPLLPRLEPAAHRSRGGALAGSGVAGAVGVARKDARQARGGLTPGMRRIVRTVSSPYTRRLVSAQPSASDVHEESRTKTPSPSGRLLLRMPPDLHGELAQAAEREGTSLNGYIIARLGEAVGRTPESGAVAGSSGLSAVTLRRLLIANVVTVALASVAALAILLVAWLG